MAVVVTGAAGFLGRALVDGLATDGVDVVAVDRRPSPAGAGVTVLRADLLDGDPAVRPHVRGHVSDRHAGQQAQGGVGAPAGDARRVPPALYAPRPTS